VKHDDTKLKAHHTRENKFISYGNIFTRDKVGRINFIYGQTFRFGVPRLYALVKKVLYARHDTRINEFNALIHKTLYIWETAFRSIAHPNTFNNVHVFTHTNARMQAAYAVNTHNAV